MKRSLLAGTGLAFVVGFLCVGCAWTAEDGGTAAQGRAVSMARSKGQTAVEVAAASGKHLFIFFFKPGHARGKELRPLFEETMNELAADADAIAIDVTDPIEKELVEKYHANSVVLMVVSLSPGGQVVQAFAGIFQKSDLQHAFLTPVMEQCQKHFKDGRLVILSVQSGTKEERERAMAGVNAFKTDMVFGHMAEVVEVAANDPKEARLVAMLGVDPKTEQTVTLLLFPSVGVMARLSGATRKQELIEAILKSATPDCKCGG